MKLMSKNKQHEVYACVGRFGGVIGEEMFGNMYGVGEYVYMYLHICMYTHICMGTHLLARDSIYY